MALGACGTLLTDEKEVLAIIEELKDKTLIASYRVGKSNAYVRVILGGSHPEHVHIDVYKKEAFKKVLPKATHKRREIERILDVFVGKKVSTFAYGQFLLPIMDLPEGGLIRSTFFGTKQGNLSISVSRTVFSIKGAPIRTLAWQFAENLSAVKIDIDAMVETEISEDYLNEQLQLLDSGFRLFVLGNNSDDAD